MRRPLFVFLLLLAQGGCRHDLTLCRDENDGPACREGEEDAIVEDGAADGELEAGDDGGVDSADASAPLDTGVVDSGEVIDAAADSDLPGSDADGGSESGDAGALDSSIPDTFVAVDSFVADTFVADTYVADTYVADTYVADTYVADTFKPDTSVADTFVPDTFVADTFVADTYVADTFKPDTFVADTYVADTYVADTYVADTYVADTFVADTFVADTAPACTTGTYRCGGAGGNELAQCSGSGYTLVVTCPAGTCSATLGRCTFCSPSAYSCSGATRQQCDSFGSKLTTVETCVTADLCAAGGCAAPVCAATDSTCAGPMPWSLRSCNAGRTGFVDTACTIGCAGGACSTVATIAGSGDRMCALLGDGTLRCWNSASLPTLIPGVSSAVQVAVASTRMGARMSDGTVRVWPDLTGVGGTADAPGSSVPVAGVTGAESLAVGDQHACVQLTGGAVKCWGQNGDGQLGTSPTATPASIPPALVTVTGLSATGGVFAGSASSFAIVADGARAWGLNDAGQLGVGVLGSKSSPTPAFPLAVSIAPGMWHACAVTSAGNAICAGTNSDGQLGDGSTGAPRSSPSTVLGIDGLVTQVVSGDRFSCALLKDGTVRCWGLNVAGQLGDGSLISHAYPAPVTGLTGVKQLAAGESGACALLNDQTTVRCWGAAVHGPGTSSSTSPTTLAWH